MTITRRDVQELSSGPGPGGVALLPAQADRVAAVLNRFSSDSSASRPLGTAEPDSLLTPLPEIAPLPAAWSRHAARPQLAGTPPGPDRGAAGLTGR